MVRSLVVAGVAGVSLFGCGGQQPAPGPTPAPAPSGPTTVEQLIEWHFQAFNAKDLDRIMEDYDDENVWTLFNDGCPPDGVLREFKGRQIRRFFEVAFANLNQSAIEFPPFNLNGKDVGNPSIEGAEVSMLTANSFTVYTALPATLKSSDTIYFKQAGPVVKFKKTNVVVTQPGFCNIPGFTPSKPVADPGSKITQGWNAYLAAFTAQDKTEILEVFSNTSIVQTYTMDVGYERYEGLEAIGTMFETLWTSMNAQQSGGSIGFDYSEHLFPRVDVDAQVVLFAWSSYSNPKAADSFVFDLDGKILRQTTVTVAGGQAPPPAVAV